MKISVIMSVYNEEVEWIEESIKSILEQTYKNFELIIIVDNPNRRDILSTIERYQKLDSRIKIIKNEKNMGLVYSLNKGISISEGYYIARMDADDICIKDRFEKQVNYLNNNNDTDLLITKAYFINEKGELIGESKSFKGKEQISKSLRYKNRLIHPTWMIRKSVLIDKKINMYKNIPYAEDYDLAYRLILNGFKIEQLDEYCLYYRVRDNGISKSNYYDTLKSTIFISKNIKMYHNSGYKNYEIDLNDLINKTDNKKFDYINKNIKNSKLKKIFFLACKYYRLTVVNNLICKVTTNI